MESQRILNSQEDPKKEEQNMEKTHSMTLNHIAKLQNPNTVEMAQKEAHGPEE